MVVPRGGPGALWRGRFLGLSLWRVPGQGLALALLALWSIPSLATHLSLLALAVALGATLGLALAATLAFPLALAWRVGASLGNLAHVALGAAPLVVLVVLALVVGLELVGPLVVLASLVVVG